MSRQIRILILENQALLRAGLCALLESERDLEIVGEGDDADHALNMIGELNPDLLLMDISIPGSAGLDALMEIRARFPSIKILIVTRHKTDECIRDAFRAGAMGYILTTANRDELSQAIRSVAGGQLYLSPGISDQVVRGYLGRGQDGAQASPWDQLTKREREILKLVAQGEGNKHIATQLQLSIKTVEKHRSNLMHKLGMRNAAMLTAYAIDRGLVSSEYSG